MGRTINEQSNEEVRELSTAEIEEVSGGFVELLVVAAVHYAHYQYCKATGKI